MDLEVEDGQIEIRRDVEIDENQLHLLNKIIFEAADNTVVASTRETILSAMDDANHET